MQRITGQPRTDWQKRVESQGFHFHTADDEPYWDESAYYRFTAGEVDVLEAATQELDRMCLAAVEQVIAQRRFEQFQIPPEFVDLVCQSWERDEFTVYGRFDLAYDGQSPPKLLEYNADTPTALLEAAVVQWFWFKDVLGDLDQFNSIHERLIEAWGSQKGSIKGPIHFAAMADSLEDFMTVNYLRDTAIQAGFKTQYLPVEEIGWNAARRCFTDQHEKPLDCAFKLYPWEWMLREDFGPHLLEGSTRWLEAPWKMLLSNKAILAVLYELFPDSPYLLEASFEPLSGAYVRKPLFSREGANIVVMEDGVEVLTTDGVYTGPYVYQRRWPLRAFDGRYPVIGSWMVNGYACGIGIREDTFQITQNTSRFVPHVFTH